MIRLLFVFLYLAHLVQGASNTTSSSCPSGDATSRSIWSILGSCGLTLLICVWYAIHPNVPCRRQEWYETLWKRVKSILLSFFIPEAMVANAAEDWWDARDKVIRFRAKKYEWSMIHSHFAEMGGFVYRDDGGDHDLGPIDSLEFLRLCEEGEIANPVITVDEIMDRSKSDAPGKAIFGVQLFWFILQVVVRGSNGLAVTLVELDTVCMAALTVFLLFFWWDKPLRPDYPHIFYSPDEAQPHPQTDLAFKLSNAWKSEPSYLCMLMACFVRIRKPQSIAGGEERPLEDTGEEPVPSNRGKLMTMIDNNVALVSLCGTWLILGALHLIAWKFEFATEAEKIIWRVAALTLAGGPLAVILVLCLSFAFKGVGWYEGDRKFFDVFFYFAFALGVVSRALLVGLMLASLRALPCSAYQTVSWTAYIPHF